MLVAGEKASVAGQISMRCSLVTVDGAKVYYPPYIDWINASTVALFDALEVTEDSCTQVT